MKSWDQLTQKFDAMQPRERAMVFAAGAVIIAGLGFVLVIDGAMTRHKAAVTNAAAQSSSLAQLQSQNAELSRILIGMHDYDTGLDMKTFTVTANFDLDGTPAGQNLAERFQKKSQGVWELALREPLQGLPRGKLTVDG